MNGVHHHRGTWTYAGVPFIVFLMARLVFLGNMESFDMPVSRTVSNLEPASIRAKTVKAKPVQKAAIHTRHAGVVSNHLQMNSMQSEYRYSFSGHVLCAGQPCSRTVVVTLESDSNSGLSRTVQSGSDGSFSVDMSFTEYAGRPIDWHISVPIPDAPAADMHGRIILSDEHDVFIERTLVLP